VAARPSPTSVVFLARFVLRVGGHPALAVAHSSEGCVARTPRQWATPRTN